MTPTGLLAALACSLGFLYQSQQVISWYLQYDFSVVPSELIRSGIIFPAVTVCLDAWMNVRSLCQYRPGNCSKKDMTITYGVFKPQYEPELRAHGSYRPDQLFQCRFISSDSRCGPVDCLRSIQMTYFRPLMKQCYTMDPWEQTEFLNCPTPWNWELHLEASWEPRETMTFFDTGFLPTVVHSPRTCPPDKLSAVALQPGKLLSVAVRQQRVVRLPSPYKSHCSDYIEKGVVPALQGYLNYDSCMQHCAMELERDQCGCVRPLHEFAGAVGWKNCPIQESDACFHLLNDSGVYESCNDKCGLPCEEVVYDVRVTGVSDLQGPNERNRFGILVKFASDVQQLIHYEPVFTSVEVLGYLSGYLGIWLGLCFATVSLEAQSRLRDLCSRRQPSAWSRDMWRRWMHFNAEVLRRQGLIRRRRWAAAVVPFPN